MVCCRSTSRPNARWPPSSGPTRRSSSSRCSVGFRSTSQPRSLKSKPPNREVSKLPGVTPFPEELAARYRELGYWEDNPQGRYYNDVFATHGDLVAMVSGDDRVTFAQLKERIDRLALHLLELGVAPLDRWVVQLPNVPEFVYLYFALQRLGAIPIMALASHRWTEINAFFELSEASGYAVSEKLGDFDSSQLIAPIREAHPELRVVLGAATIRQLLTRKPSLGQASLDRVEVDPEEPCILGSPARPSARQAAARPDCRHPGPFERAVDRMVRPDERR